MTSKLGLMISSITAVVFFMLMGVFDAVGIPLMAIFSGIILVIAIIMIIVCGVGWWEDTKQEKRDAERNLRR